MPPRNQVSLSSAGKTAERAAANVGEKTDACNYVGNERRQNRNACCAFFSFNLNVINVCTRIDLACPTKRMFFVFIFNDFWRENDVTEQAMKLFVGHMKKITIASSRS